MQNRHFRTWCSLLGLLAILMAVLAPAVSQLVVAARPAMTVDASCPMESMASMASMQRDEDGPAAAHSHTTMPDGQACGYCGLLAHVPVLPGVPLSFAVTVRAMRIIVAARFDSVQRSEPRDSCHARAPPAFS